MSLRLRLVLALAPLFVLGLVVADIVTYSTLHSQLFSQLDAQLLDVHPSVEQEILDYNNYGGQGHFGPGQLPPGVPPGTYGVILTSSGQPEPALEQSAINEPYTNSSKPAGLPRLPAITPAMVGTFFDASGSGGVSSYRVYVDNAHLAQGDTSLNDLLVVAVPADNANATLGQVLLLEILITGGLTLVVGGATWYIVRSSLQPLERMAVTARSIVASDLSRRVQPSDDRTEVGQLGLALNTMLAQLESAFAERERNEQRLRHFISDASHELRTPLTSVQGYAELLQRQREMEPKDVDLATRRIEDETRRMSLLVDDLLLLARLDQGRPLDRHPVDLESLVTDACSDARVADPSRQITTSVGAPLVVSGDEMRLRQVLGNLVRNALVHTPAGTPVEIALRPEAGRAVIEVIDHGRGIAAQQRGRIFERFHRLDPELSGDRGGSGLGLSIVSAVVQAHGGSVAVADTPGGGATFRVELPLFDAVPLRPEPVPAPPPLP